MARKREQGSEKRDRQNTEKPGFVRQVIEFLKSIGFALVAVVFLNSFVLASFQVPTGSMENTVMAGDLLFVNKFIYGGTTPPTVPIIGVLFGTEIEIPFFRIPGFRDPERGDVIVFIFPGTRDRDKPVEFQYYLKRCVAISGDTIRIIDKQVYINGKKSGPFEGMHFIDTTLPASRIDAGIFPRGKTWNKDHFGPLVVPSEGDVIELSYENIIEWMVFIQREGHKIDLRDNKIFVDGKETTSYTVERDYVFGMGDNRDDSLDSRFWGFIPKEHVIGTPMIVYWSWDPNIPIKNIIKKLGSVRLSRVATIIR